MTCPNCYCTTCQAERAKWTAPPMPHSYIAPPTLMPGYWACGCGQIHPPGYTCCMAGVTQNTPPLSGFKP